MTQIQHISIERFRGIGEPILIDFPLEEKGTTRPILILGSNGSGKSSICEAIEFAARGSVSRRYQNGEKDRRELQNLIKGGAPAVKLTLSTGQVIQRGRGAGGQGGFAHEDFSKAPLILRRKSVESFWGIQESNRLEIFWDFFKPIDTEWRSPLEQKTIDDYYENRRYVEKDWRSYLEFLQLSRPLVIPRSMEAFERQLEWRRKSKAFRKLSKDDLIYFDEIVHELRWSLAREMDLRPRAVQAESKPVIDYDLLRDILNDASTKVARTFREISRTDWIDDVSLEPEGRSGLATRLTLLNGKTVDPTDVLSEANLDLLALLIHIQMQVAAADRGQARVLILDDVFQSVDAPLRQRAMRVIIQELSDWQLIITLHDRLWMEILTRICTDSMRVSPSLIELRNESAGEGPTVHKTGAGLLRDLHFVINNAGSPVLLIGACGRALEALSDQLSMSLKCKVVRMPGDKYSIGDLLPTVLEKLNSNVNSDVRDSAKHLQYAQFSRNTFGAHHHVEGDLVSPEEALDIADAVIRIAEASVCPKCGSVMGKNDIKGNGSGAGGSQWQFSCKKHGPRQVTP